MAVSDTSNTANGGLSEHTPLLKQHRPEQVPTSVDEEAQWHAPREESVVKEAPGSIGGVISILLLGTEYHLFLDPPSRNIKLKAN